MYRLYSDVAADTQKEDGKYVAVRWKFLLQAK